MVSWAVVIKQFAPGPAFAPFVRAFEVVETGADEAVTRTLLPEMGVLVGFRYSGHATLLDDVEPPRRMPDASVTGLRGSVRQMHTSPNGGIILVKFRAAGAAPFFTEPLHHLFGLIRGLDELFDQAEVASTARGIASATSDEERIGILEQFLATQHKPSTADPIVSGALRAICTSAGAIRVGAIARALDVSQDTLEKRFRRIVGASPKQFASIVRVRRAVDLSKENASLTALALDAGYYDQSHFIRDFRAITGDAPGHFFESATYC